MRIKSSRDYSSNRSTDPYPKNPSLVKVFSLLRSPSTDHQVRNKAVMSSFFLQRVIFTPILLLSLVYWSIIESFG
jgi:hypothetical protein